MQRQEYASHKATVSRGHVLGRAIAPPFARLKASLVAIVVAFVAVAFALETVRRKLLDNCFLVKASTINNVALSIKRG